MGGSKTAIFAQVVHFYSSGWVTLRSAATEWLRLGFRMGFSPVMPGQNSTYTRVRNSEATSDLQGGISFVGKHEACLAEWILVHRFTSDGGKPVPSSSHVNRSAMEIHHHPVR